MSAEAVKSKAEKKEDGEWNVIAAGWAYGLVFAGEEGLMCVCVCVSVGWCALQEMWMCAVGVETVHGACVSAVEPRSIPRTHTHKCYDSYLQPVGVSDC
jgi:hypothetical protein